MKIAIRSRWDASVLFEAEVADHIDESLRLRAAVEIAVGKRANLARANLASAYLAGANLAGANLAGANLASAYLAGANLAGANLARANLADAYLAGAKNCTYRDRPMTVTPISITGLRWRVLIIDDAIEIGCELHTHAEWAALDDRRIAQMDGRAALTFWREHRDPLLALCRIHAARVAAPAADAA